MFFNWSSLFFALLLCLEFTLSIPLALDQPVNISIPSNESRGEERLTSALKVFSDSSGNETKCNEATCWDDSDCGTECHCFRIGITEGFCMKKKAIVYTDDDTQKMSTNTSTNIPENDDYKGPYDQGQCTQMTCWDKDDCGDKCTCFRIGITEGWCVSNTSDPNQP